jgi:hypothetical protein
MHWDYRIIKHIDPTGDYYVVHECFYGRGKYPKSWTVDEISPAGETRADIKKSIQMYKKDLKKPVLIEKNGKIVGEEKPLW